MKITKPFQDSEVLGRFTGPTINQVAQAEELRCAYERIAELEAALRHAEEALFWYDGMKFELDGRTIEEAINQTLHPEISDE